MANYYFDSINGSDVSGDGTQGNPWATWASKGGLVFANDTAFFKRGTTQVILAQFAGMRSSTSFKAYGPYGPLPRIIYGGTFWGYTFNLSNVSNILIEDIDFDGVGVNSALLIQAQTAGSVSGITMRRCLVHNSGGRSGVVYQNSGSTGTISGLLFEYSDFYDNGEHGIIGIAATGIKYKRCRAWNNGGQSINGGHGFSSRWDRSDVTSGWTLVSGTCYSRTISGIEAIENAIGYVAVPVANHGRMTLNTVTPTNPGLYGYGVVVNVPGSQLTLYVDAGINLNTVKVRYAFRRCTNLVYEDCEAFNNKVNTASPFQEGNGFAFDDYTDTSTVRRCKSHDNQGRGFSVNQGDNNLIEDCAAWGNGLTAVSSNTSSGLTIRRSTFVYNGLGNFITPNVVPSEMYFSPQVQASISQSVLVASPGSLLAISDDPFTTISVDRCSISGAAAVGNAITPTNAIAGNPKVTAQGAPMPGSPLIGAGVHSGYTRDVNRVQRRRPPTIGAYDVARRITYPALA